MVLIRWITSPFRYGLAVLKRKIGKLGLARMELFLAFGNEKEIFIKGRIVEAYRQSRPSENKNAFQNIIAAIRRYAGSSIPDVRIMLEYHHLRIEMVSDEEGIFEKRFDDPHPVTNNKEKARLNIIKEPGIQPENEWIEIDILRYASDHDFGIISDIDDTIKHTEVTSRRRLLINTFLNHFQSIRGMSEAYQQWAGRGAVFHYVSSSPWQLFDHLHEFSQAVGFPDGSVHLRAFRLRDHMLRRMLLIRRRGKATVIRSLLSTFPDRRFLLVGDSGELDPEIYAKAARRFPQQVSRIVIRELPQRPLRGERQDRLMRQVPEEKWHLFHDAEELLHAPLWEPPKRGQLVP
jgi:phosphatidate phosphatase APP1